MFNNKRQNSCESILYLWISKSLKRTKSWAWMELRKYFWKVSVFNWLGNVHKMLLPFEQNKVENLSIEFPADKMIYIRFEPALPWRESLLSWRGRLASGETDEHMEPTNVSTPSSPSTLMDFRLKIFNILRRPYKVI